MDNNRFKIKDVFGINVFDDNVMSDMLPKSIYKSLKKTIEQGKPLDEVVADVVANTMKNWAVEKGATHFTHWFQPLTGVTAEKHDSFMMPTASGSVVNELSGKKLIKGESDASSFPSGGTRATFEARGYTVWDCTSPAFLKEDKSGVTLCIPTAFYSYNGVALDNKTPLLRSMEALSNEALRVLRAMGNTTSKRVIASVGAEQEYFLIKTEHYEKRKDLIFTGRTLFGSRPPKGEEMEDHYYGALKEKVSVFMKELDLELWKMGVSSKTKHNEVAPSQHELAPVYATANIAADHNQIIMETLKKVALRHGFACLLHEKPFAGISGSGKHNNWSLVTDDGIGLLEPGATPQENAQFLIFLCAVIKAVDKYAELLRASVSNAGNDCRLGENEAPPTVISIFLGSELSEILNCIENDHLEDFKNSNNKIELGVSTLPRIPQDSTDRNRTSPFAFTGNKFEFRMLGSSASISNPNVVLNTAVADVLSEIADRLENAKDKKQEINIIVKEIIKNHKRVLFDGNGYSEEWLKEAEKRGLPCAKDTISAYSAYLKDDSLELFNKFNVMNRTEVESRYEIYLDTYVKEIIIEARTMVDMAKKEILPAVMKYSGFVAENINIISKSDGADTSYQTELLKELTKNIALCGKNVKELEITLEKASGCGEDILQKAKVCRDTVLPSMKELRKVCDAMEELTDKEYWPMPSYSDILFYL